jgi:hypothetical protein
MFIYRKIGLLLLLGLAIAAIVILAGGLPAIDLAPGQPLPGAMPAEEGGIQATQEGGDIILVALRYFLLLMGFLFPFGVLYVIVSPEARKQVLRALASLIWIPALYIAIRARPKLFELDNIQPPDMAGQGGEAAFGAPVEFAANPSSGLIIVMTIGLGVMLALLVVGTGWSVWRRRQRSNKKSLDELADEVQQAIDSLQAGGDLKNVVMRCYFDMSQTLREQRGIERDAAMTPREFETELECAGLPPQHVKQLTRLFEAVRYGAKSASEEEQEAAITCLTAIVDACRSTG